MASHNDFGKQGEDMAARWLIQNGYEILHRNWRHSYHEIDIIAVRGDTLHIIEVKTRKYSPYGNPEDSVSKRKFRHLKKAADEFLFLNPGYKWLQYGILAITLHKNGNPEFFLLEDVFL